MTAGEELPRRRSWGRGRAALLLYVVLLAASFGVRAFRAEPGSASWQRVVLVPAVGGGEHEEPVRVALHEWGRDATQGLPIVLLHGSPGDGRTFNGLGPMLAGRRWVLAPDLPGFGGSSRDVPDYSIRSHAAYVAAVLDSLGLRRVHLVGFSMGGGVAIELAATAPERVASLTLLSSIGVQELELLGDYELNHALHALQLGGLWLLREGIPHFGALDDVMLSVPYARNFYDTDQRPLRGLLQRYAGPMLIVHGERDRLVPARAAREHARIVPQAELAMLPDGHFMTFMRPELPAGPIAEFVARVEQGEATVRATAGPERVARASEPFVPGRLPGAEGFGLVVVLGLLALATLVSEDFTCLGAGLLVARGSIGFGEAVLACLVGIFVGDLLLVLAGRWLGTGAVRRAPVKWLVTPEALARSTQWFARRGPALIFVTRFVPGTRLPTYLAAGVLRMPLWRFSIWFLLAAGLWTPFIVGGTALLGREVVLGLVEGLSFPALLGGVLLLLLVLRLGMAAVTWRGRRLLLSRWRRVTRWEFWPLAVFYPPIVLYVLYLGLKHRSLTLFTAANPAIPAGGFVGESKAEIFRGLEAGSPGAVAPFALLPAEEPPARRIERAREFLRRAGLGYPVVLKPDAGERGRDVAVVRSEERLVEYLGRVERDTLIQEYVGGLEYGVFAYRYPEGGPTRIFAITTKRLQSVTGDGTSTLETLILRDDRAVCQAPLFLRRHAERLLEVPAAGEVVPLGVLGNHCQGAVFHDGTALATPALEAAMDRLVRGYEGFSVGRFDVRVPSREDFQAGRSLRVIELNGVTSEATSIYDPTHRLVEAYRTLARQWRIVFAIAAQHRARGVRPAGVGELVRALWAHYGRGAARARAPGEAARELAAARSH